MFTEWNSLLAIHKSHITFLKPHTSWTQPPNVHKLHVRHVEQLCTNFHLRQVQESGEINVGWFNWWRCEFAIVWLDWSRELTGGGELLFYRAWLSPLVLIQPSDVILPEWNTSVELFFYFLNLTFYQTLWLLLHVKKWLENFGCSVGN